MQVHSIAILHHDYNIRFRLLVAIGKDLSRIDYFILYEYGEANFAMFSLDLIVPNKYKL